MTSGNTQKVITKPSGSTSGNKSRSRRVALPDPYAIALDDYETALTRSSLAESSQGKYASRVRGFLAWVAEAEADGTLDGDPLADHAAATWAVRDYRRMLKNGRTAPTTIDNVLSAVDDFYQRHGLGRTGAQRERYQPSTAPKALDERETRRYLREVERSANTRDTALALLPLLAGLRIGEVVGLDTADVRMSARKGELWVIGKGRDGGKVRKVPIHPTLRTALQAWIDERPHWPGADSDALFLNRRGGRITDRAARTIITGLGTAAGIGDDPAGPFGPHVLRHSFGTQLVRGGKDIVLVASLMGHARLDTTRRYTQPTDDDMTTALDVLITDT
ncbi:tyrosine recombinase XerC [Nonomuraea typhae]|uniref:Tyrosine recombinase XerC n=1 Tax=Nonomuraea typhae TaxID=2603600 RepID=A0ABW7YKL1_9ACTN